MVDQTEIQRERERLYESESLREDINDDEATVLLEWGEKHIVRLAGEVEDEKGLEQQARFLRQLIKNINRFVGQRQYDNREEQLGYMAKVVQWLPNLRFKTFTSEELLDKLPPDAKDMAETLRALLAAIDPSSASVPHTPEPAPQNPQSSLKEDAVQNTHVETAPPHATQDKAIHEQAVEATHKALSPLDALRQSVENHLKQALQSPEANDALKTLRDQITGTHAPSDHPIAKDDPKKPD